MKIARTFLIILVYVLTIMPACSGIPRSLRSSFTYCYDGIYTGIDTLINIDGYYKETFFDKEPPTIDTVYHYFMFYDNGLYVYAIRDTYYDNRSRKWIKKDISSFLKDFSENSEAPGANYFYGNFWGSYIMCGDTIKVQRIYKGVNLSDGWAGSEIWYKIIDKNTILCINAFNLPITFHPQLKKRERFPITFSPILAKPDSDESWILREKWFWCNEQDWRDYMEKIRKKK